MSACSIEDRTCKVLTLILSMKMRVSTRRQTKGEHFQTECSPFRTCLTDTSARWVVLLAEQLTLMPLPAQLDQF